MSVTIADRLERYEREIATLKARAATDAVLLRRLAESGLILRIDHPDFCGYLARGTDPRLVIQHALDQAESLNLPAR